jgi:hypothetical protein
MPLKSIAYFVSSHGFGHAARSAAVMQAIAVEESEFYGGSWVSKIRELLEFSRVHRQGVNGAEQIGKFIFALI